MVVLISIHAGMPATIVTENPADNHNPIWRTGFYKKQVAGPVRVGKLTLEGDGQADLAVHGGEDRPILAYCAEHYPRWREELHMPDVMAGAFGENFTISGMDEDNVCLGDQYLIGPVTVEVSQPRQPCWKLARKLERRDLPAKVIEHCRGGWYFRVLHEGTIQAGLSVDRITRPHPQWTIRQAMDVMYDSKAENRALQELASLPALSMQWREHFERRLNGGL